MNDLKEIREAIARQIRIEMAALNLNDDQLAEKSGLARPTINQLRNGKQGDTLDTLCKVADGLNKKLVIRFEPPAAARAES